MMYMFCPPPTLFCLLYCISDHLKIKKNKRWFLKRVHSSKIVNLHHVLYNAITKDVLYLKISFLNAKHSHYVIILCKSFRQRFSGDEQYCIRGSYLLRICRVLMQFYSIPYDIWILHGQQLRGRIILIARFSARFCATKSFRHMRLHNDF